VVETFKEVRDELLNEARLRRRRVTEPSMHSWESEPNKEGDVNGMQSEPSPKSPRLLSDADSTSTDWRLSGTWALHNGKEMGEDELSWGSFSSDDPLSASIDLTEDSEQESISHVEDDSLNGTQDPLADNAIVWKDRRGAKVIKAATPSALVYMLADSTVYQDKDFVDTFLLTYEYWTDSVTFLRMLITQFRVPKLRVKPAELEAEERAKLFIQLRVINVLKKWLEMKYTELKRNKEWHNTLLRFLKQLATKGDRERSWAAHLKKLMRQQSEFIRKSFRVPAASNPTQLTGARSAGESGNLKPKSIMDFPVKEFVRNMCLVDYFMFKGIPLTNYFRKQFEKDQIKKQNSVSHMPASPKMSREGSSGNLLHKSDGSNSEDVTPVVKATERFNQMTYWVATEIVLSPNSKERAKVLTRFIQIMDELRQESNFNGMMQIYAALNYSYVTRLRKSWAELDSKTLTTFKSIQHLLSTTQNYKIYRDMLESVQQPCVPVQGFILGDLVYIEELTDREGDKQEYVNWEKMTMLAKVFGDVIRFQKVPYAYEEDLQITSFLLALPQQARILSERELQERSATAEKDEDLAGSSPGDKKKKGNKDKKSSKKNGAGPLTLSDIWAEKSLFDKFKAYMVKAKNVENLMFCKEVEMFKKIPANDPQLTLKAKEVIEHYFNMDSDNYLSSLDEDRMREIKQSVREGGIGPDLFNDAQIEVESLVLKAAFTNFLQEK
jgi:hypothetical protein